MQAHLVTESYLKTLTTSPSPNISYTNPFTFTAIREGIYSESFPLYTSFFDLNDPQREVKLPEHDGSGPGIAWAKIGELGEATARLVKDYVDSTDKSHYKNQIVLLSGPKEWSIADTLQVVGDAIGQEVRIKKVGIDEYVNDPIIKKKLPLHGRDDVPRKWTTSFEAVKAGETAVVSGELEKLLGRKPEGFEETVRAMVKTQG